MEFYIKTVIELIKHCELNEEEAILALDKIKEEIKSRRDNNNNKINNEDNTIINKENETTSSTRTNNEVER